MPIDWCDSVSYRMILDEGRAEGEIRGRLVEAHLDVLEFGTDKFGPPDAATTAQIEQIDELATLHRLRRSAQNVSSWRGLLALAQEA